MANWCGETKRKENKGPPNGSNKVIKFSKTKRDKDIDKKKLHKRKLPFFFHLSPSFLLAVASKHNGFALKKNGINILFARIENAVVATKSIFPIVSSFSQHNIHTHTHKHRKNSE